MNRQSLAGPNDHGSRVPGRREEKVITLADAVRRKHVLANGQIVLKDGEHTGATPGRALNG